MIPKIKELHSLLKVLSIGLESEDESRYFTRQELSDVFFIIEERLKDILELEKGATRVPQTKKH